MCNYIIFTDSACDIPQVLLRKWDVELIHMTCRFEGYDYLPEAGEFTPEQFYSMLRRGYSAKTSAPSVEDYTSAFEPELKNGKDLLYIALSSAIGSSYANAVHAADDLKEKYPERRIEVVDSLSASCGLGILIYLAAVRRRHGASLDDIVEYLENNRLRICHWFTVGDLDFLNRGGRVTQTMAIAGKLLGVKPVLCANDDGQLRNVMKVRSRKTSIRTLADKYGQHVSAQGSKVVLIAHADCRSDADELAAILRHDYRVKVHQILDIGPVIGAHAGPDSLALFFISDECSRGI